MTYAWFLVGLICSQDPNKGCEQIWINPVPYSSREECMEIGAQIGRAGEIVRCERRPG